MAQTKTEKLDRALLEKAKALIVKEKKASASFLQRKLSIGYAAAARLLDQLEEEGFIGPENGAKPRKIFGKKPPKKGKNAKKKAKNDEAGDLIMGDDEDTDNDEEVFENPPNDSESLTLKQKLFCDLYASDRQFFANGTQSYIEAYNVNISKKGAYDSARSCAHRLLTNVHICKYIAGLLDSVGLNDNFVDKQLEFTITQHVDLKAKLAGIKEYNQLRNRIKSKKTTENPDGSVTREYENLSDEELENELNKGRKN